MICIHGGFRWFQWKNHQAKWWIMFVVSSTAEMRRPGPVRRATRRFAMRWPCRMPQASHKAQPSTR